eukprot:11377329-Prorocentrum_lima.AAC.1
MTSSLVGSEMCIRDSFGAGFLAWPQDVAPSGASSSGGGCIKGHWAHFGPVSYTHLTLPTICSV